MNIFLSPREIVWCSLKQGVRDGRGVRRGWNQHPVCQVFLTGSNLISSLIVKLVKAKLHN